MYIYFVQAVDGGPIKIGFSSTPEYRLKSMQTCNPKTLQIIGLVKGSIAKEKELHSYFNSCRIRDEWFKPSKELLALIKQLPNIENLLVERSVPTFVETKDIVFELFKRGYSFGKIGYLFKFSRQRAHQLAVKTGNKLYGFERSKSIKPIEEAYDEIIKNIKPLDLTQ